MKLEKNKLIALALIGVVMIVFFPMTFFNIEEHSNITGLLSFLGLLFGTLGAMFIGLSNSSQSH